jgi:Fur family ferric uptake transcriptional regulator
MPMKEEVSNESIKKIFTDYLEQNRHRKTPERYAILERIINYQEHFDAEKLYKDMQLDYRVSLATVYNTLDLLINARLIVKHQFGGQQAVYESIVENNTHHHIICTNCGKIKEFSDRNLRVAIQSKRFSNFNPSHYGLIIYGVCSKCKQISK